MKTTRFISALLIFVGTIGFAATIIANSVLIAFNYLRYEEIMDFGMYKLNAIFMGFSIVLLFAGAVVLITEYALETKKKMEK